MNPKTENPLSPQSSALSPSPTSAPSAPPREQSEESVPDIHQQLVGLRISLDQLTHALAEHRHIDAGFHFEKARQRFAQIETTLAALKEKFAV